MAKDLKAKAEVIRDLLAQGAQEVEIIGTDIKVIRSNNPEKSGSNTTQIVNVSTQATLHSSTSINLQLNLARLELEVIYKNSGKLPEIKKNFNVLEKELAKNNPDKSKLKKILKWALDAG